MVSAEQHKTASRKLAQWLDNEKKIVTFREISREVGCHVNTAKNILLRHYKANPSLAPTYLLSGPLRSSASLAQTSLEPTGPASPGATQSLAHLATQGVRIVDMDEMSDADRNSEPDVDEDGVMPGNDHGAEDGTAGGRNIKVERDDDEVEAEEVPKWGCVLVQQDKLDEKKKLFEAKGLSIHIYALSPAPVKDPAQYLVSGLSVRGHKAYFKPEIYGTITGEAFKSAAAPLKDGGMDWGKKDTKTASVKEEKKTGKDAKAAVKEEEKSDDKKASRKGDKEKDAPETKPSTADAMSKSGKASVELSKKTTASKKRASTADEDDASVPSKPGSSKTPLQPTSSMTRADDAAAMEAMMDMDFDMGSGGEDEAADDEAKPAPSKKPKGKAAKDEVQVKKEPGQRKRRKVKTTEMVEENGYMVTRDTWREESYSGDSEPEPLSKVAKGDPRPVKKSDSVEPPKKAETKASSAPKPASKPPGPMKKGPGGQGTLTGFFKKK